MRSADVTDWDRFRHALPPPGPDVVADGELLARFTAGRDDEAFSIIVRRHGPMVLGVARRVLRDLHSAEDVFQATFLALARQAKSLGREPAVAGWLYRVAVRIAQRASKLRRSDGVTRGAVTRGAYATPLAVNDIDQRELLSTLDAAIARLPEKLRRAVVLCYLSGHTTEQAARLLDCPKGTVLSRLSAAREKLRGDLTRRGITVSVATLGTTLAGESLRATVPSALIALTVNLIKPAAVIGPAVLVLAKGAIAMSWTKLSLAAFITMATGVGLGVGMAGPQAKPTEPPAAKQLVAGAERKAQEAAKAREMLEREMMDFIHANMRRRIEYQRRVLELRQELAAVQNGLKAIEVIIEQAQSRAVLNSLGLDKAGILKPDATGDEILKKVQARTLDLQIKLFTAEEEMRNHDEMAALRLDMVKQKHAAMLHLESTLRLEATQWDK